MKITFTLFKAETVTKEVPPFFRLADWPMSYFMLMSDKACIQVSDIGWDMQSLSLFPKIEGTSVNYLRLGEREIIPISEAEYKAAFLKVSMELETISN